MPASSASRPSTSAAAPAAAPASPAAPTLPTGGLSASSIAFRSSSFAAPPSPSSDPSEGRGCGGGAPRSNGAPPAERASPAAASGGGGGGTAAAEVDEAPAASGGAAEVDLDVVVSDAEERMKKSLSSVQEQLATLRVGRATPDMLDRVLVDYYDTPTPLKQLASVTCPTATQLVVDVYDKSALGDVEKGLMASDIGMTPSNDGSVIRLNVPQLTKDRRVELAKTAKGIGEGGKTALRNVRRDAIDKIKKAVKAAGLSEDASKDKEGAVDKKLKKYEGSLDEAVSAREKEITTL
mmetsp:Transcript_48318/g.155498  ORF Transcript_48318/g.155498 Transcript_48318/m.155498 type:complete len:294 (-) Transcript_48318:142-1023(-)